MVTNGKKMKQLHTYTDQNGTIVFKTLVDKGSEADEQFEKTFGKKPLDIPMLTCRVTFVKEENVV